MSRLSDCFQARRDARKKVLITYAMAGYPNKAGTVNMINGMIEGGADIVEIGFPFSDPLADGKLIQKASTIALGHKMNLDAYFKIVSSVRKSHPNGSSISTVPVSICRVSKLRLFIPTRSAGISTAASISSFVCTSSKTPSPLF